MSKYSAEFAKGDYTVGPYPKAHALNTGEDIPPHGDAQPRMTGDVIKHPEPLGIGLSYNEAGNPDFGPYIQRCGEGLPNSFSLDFTNRQKFYAGNVHPHTGLMLFALGLNLRPKVIIETGTYIGYSTMYLAKICETWKEGKVYTIDCDTKPCHEDIRNNPYVELITNYSHDALPPLLEKVGEVQMAFIDSWKRASLQEFKLIHPYMAEGGIFAFHDTQFLNTGESLYNTIMRDYSDKYDTMLFTGFPHKENGHKFIGNADDRGLLVLRKRPSIDPFGRVKDYASQQHGARLL